MYWVQARREAYLKRGLTIDGRGKAKSEGFKLTQISQISQILHSDHKLTDGDIQADSADCQTHKAPDAPCSLLASDRKNLRNPNLDRDSKSASFDKDLDAQPIAQEKSASSAKSACVNNTSEQPSEKNLIAFDLFTESAGLKNVNIDTEGKSMAKC